MKQVNKDYISVVRSNSGRLLFERIPMIKSDRVKDRLAEFLDDDRATIEDMLEYLQSNPSSNSSLFLTTRRMEILTSADRKAGFSMS